MSEPSVHWWWQVLHRGHPAFHLRTLMPGDFQPGRLPLARHVLGGTVVCETCGERPRSEDLEVVERSTGRVGFLAPFRAYLAPWPSPTDPKSCEECCGAIPAGRTDGFCGDGCRGAHRARS